MIAHLKKEFRFEASHQLPNHDGKCARLHGHSWVLSVWVKGRVSENSGHPKEGMVVDYADIKSVVEPIVKLLDHTHLGTGPADLDTPEYWLGPEHTLQRMNFPSVPTSENILIWIAQQIMQTAPDFNWQCLELCETCTSAARIYATDWAAAHRKKEGDPNAN